MIKRRYLIAAAAALPLAARAQGGFDSFVAGVKAEARRAGVSDATLNAAFAGVAPNDKVLELFNHQPEFTLTWQEYRTKTVNDTRIAVGRNAYQQNRQGFAAVCGQYQVDPGVILGIWGLESNFGANKGNYRVVEALATLAWGGSARRAPFFRSELIAALRILENGDITAARMLGSYAGAMGQPQFMPSSYLRLAVDFEGNGRRDIWDSKLDSIASIANYLARSGWRAGEPSAVQVVMPGGVDVSGGRDDRRGIGEWQRLGVRRVDGAPLPAGQTAALIAPDGAGGEAFLMFNNFAAIRKYNSSDFYALAVGLIGERIVA
jgi:membrane-bound lytic murein transglycosylase B